MLTEIIEDEHSKLIPHPEGYYEIIGNTGGRVGVDAWIDKVAIIWEHHNETREPISILTRNADPSIGSTPLNYAFKKGMPLVRKYRNLPKSRSAWLVKKDMMVSLLDTFLRMMPVRIEYRYFELDEHENATEWLLEIQPEREPRPETEPSI